MKLIIRVALIVLLVISCKSGDEIENEFSCNSSFFLGETKTVFDTKNKFSAKIPKHWKINLFNDEMQSSIYFADTTKQLKKTVLIDITQLSKAYKFDEKFKRLLFENDSLLQLKNVKSNNYNFNKYPAYYSISKGKKGKFSYQIINIFVQQNDRNSFHLKTEVYGEKAVSSRFCKAIKLLKSITFNEPE